MCISGSVHEEAVGGYFPYNNDSARMRYNWVINTWQRVRRAFRL